MKQPKLCRYCGSIENHKNICDWCHNPIADDYIIENEDKKMKIKLEFTDIDPATALALMKLAAANSVDENPTDCAPPMKQPAPFQPAAAVTPIQPVMPAATAAPVVPVAPVQAAPPATPVVPVAPVPTQPVPAVPPTAVKQYTADELALAARPVCEIPGGREKLIDLLHSFTYTDSTGALRTVQSIAEMPPEQYPALANGIRQLGGRI